MSVGSLGTLFTLLVAWSFVLGAITEGLKRGAQAARNGETPKTLVRLLPLLSMLLGGASGFMVLSMLLELAGITIPDDLKWAVPYSGTFLGFGAGAVSGQVVKTYKQTILGLDKRLD